ncbi:hybrid sensor histidine kinase/response regulator [Desulfofustis glycolicus]|uniref:histidine kinase n=1 Tax=Desulfofustis glycolicus DSM 9705 TaxID=1121409 RepID=A0A1M5XZF8_9BACT|nr:PAS domain-containing sensor histidine kinase [Desulfofustis glycolicus]MCB2218255.1 PAS domain-containing protein [Desulfobulbaceae bacterium]SHI05190.1 PAS domain S-box-containing protein [Desulfofustis glycolicus DSM 9705]
MNQKAPKLRASPANKGDNSSGPPVSEPTGYQPLAQRNEHLLQQLLDTVPHCVFWKDEHFVFQGCNRQFATLVGLNEPNDIIGKTDYDLPVPKKDADFYRFCDERIIECDRAEYNFVETLQCCDDQRVWLRTNKMPLHDETGSVIGVLGIAENITEQIGIEKRLRHYEVMASTVDDLLAIISPEYRFLAVNDAYCAAYARSRDELVGMHVRELIGEELFETTMKERIDQALAGNLTHFEGWRVFPGSGERHIHYTYYPVFNDTEKVVGLVTKVHDNTRAKRLENQLQQSQKMEAIGRLAGGIAHDFNNILSIINGYSDICLFEMASDNPYRSKIEQINEAGNRAARLTQQLLGFSRKQIIQPQLLDLAEEIKVLNRMLTRLLGEGIKLRTVVDEQLWFVKMDRSQFEQVILNLAVNARDAMDESGKLTIRISNRTIAEQYRSGRYDVAAGDYVQLACCDTGSGMNPEVQARIFEPFFTTKPKGVGTGFGLSTVYGIIKQNNGFISVASEEGNGAVFTLLLPRCHGTDAQIRPHHPGEDSAVLPRGVETILLVEDDHAVRGLCVTILTDLGYTVLEAGNGKEAVETVKHFHGQIDLLLTDVVMPEMSGPEAAAILSTMQSGLQILFMSGYTEDAIVRHGVLGSDINFLQKPVGPKQLAHAIRRCLDNRLSHAADHTDR